MSAIAAASDAATRRPMLSRRVLWYGFVAAILLPLGYEAVRVLVGNNFHALVPGRVYRSAQVNARNLEKLIRTHGIRTVINLRGSSDPMSWYLDECRVTHRLAVSQEDVSCSAGRFPPTHEFRRLVEILDHCEYPILLHCRQGADRTGLAAVLVMLLQSDLTLEEARRHMSVRYGHFPFGRPTNLDRYLDLYAEWLQATGRTHCPAAVREWIADERFPGDEVCRLEFLDFPASLPAGTPAAVKLRAHNLGRRPWHLRAGSNVGVHACFWIYDPEDRCVATGRAGLFDAVVPPEEAIDLTLALPSLAPGRYRLVADMVDEPHCFFFQVGSEPLERELIVVR